MKFRLTWYVSSQEFGTKYVDLPIETHTMSQTDDDPEEDTHIDHTPLTYGK